MANGTQWLLEHVNEKCGTDYSQFQMRDILRKLTKKGVIDPKEKGSRYNFSGEKDKTVKAVIKYVSSGDAAKDRQKELDELKEKREKKAPAKTKSAPAKKSAPAEDLDDEDLDDLED